MTTTVGKTLRDATDLLSGDEARAEAELLLAHALRQPRAWLLAHDQDPMGPEARSRYSILLERRRRGEPVAYILGFRGFWSLEFSVTTDTLIPRPETELLVEIALARLPVACAARVLDLGTGSGAIALAIAKERPLFEVTAVELDERTLAIAKKNAARLGLDRVRLLRSDWYSAVLGESFDLIVSNPPYLAQDDPHLVDGDVSREPRLALVSGSDGLDAIRRIVAEAPSHLIPGGTLLIEHGWTQGEAVHRLLVKAGFSEVDTVADLAGRDRVTRGRWPD